VQVNSGAKGADGPSEVGTCGALEVGGGHLRCVGGLRVEVGGKAEEARIQESGVRSQLMAESDGMEL